MRESNHVSDLDDSTERTHQVTASPGVTTTRSPQSISQIEQLSKKDIDEKPWKYIGYRRYTEFLSTENDFLIFRRFSTVSTRVALMLQHQVSVLESKLNNLDTQYSKKDAIDVHNGSFRDDEDDRLEVLEELRLKLLDYSESS